MEIRTHQSLDPRWSGRPTAMAPGRATVELETLPAMAADSSGLVHGGFVFSLADHAAMLAVNEPTVVLARAEVRFLRPVTVGERLRAEAEVAEVAEVREAADKPPLPRVDVRVLTLEPEREVLVGSFGCVVPHRHVLAGAGATAGRAGR